MNSSNLRNSSLAALSSIVKGNNVTIKRIFTGNKGTQFLIDLISNSNDEKTIAKSLSMLADILHYKQYLKNKADIISDSDLPDQINDDFSIYFEQVDAMSNQIINALKVKCEFILHDCSMMKSFLRCAFIDCITAIKENDARENKNYLNNNIEIRQFLQNHLKIIENLVKSDDFYEVENDKLNSLMKKWM
jgi:hypothetical protein